MDLLFVYVLLCVKALLMSGVFIKNRTILVNSYRYPL